MTYANDSIEFHAIKCNKIAFFHSSSLCAMQKKSGKTIRSTMRDNYNNAP